MSALTLLVLVYLAGVLWFGLSGAKHAENSRTFLTNGGTTGVLFCALSLVSTILGGSATLGMGSLAQKTGTAAFWWLGVGAVGLLLHGLIAAPKIRALPAVNKRALAAERCPVRLKLVRTCAKNAYLHYSTSHGSSTPA